MYNWIWLQFEAPFWLDEPYAVKKPHFMHFTKTEVIYLKHFQKDI